MASTPSSPSSTAAPQQRQRLRGLLPSLSSLLPSPRRRTRPLKFQCELRVLSLRDYPQSGVLFVKVCERAFFFCKD